MSYRNLEIWQLSREVTIEVHQLTLELPKFEFYEEGRQIRRSTKSVRSNITEGYGRRKYQMEYKKFLVYALASNDESIDHLEILYETRSFRDKEKFDNLKHKMVTLGIKNNLISKIDRSLKQK